MNEIDRMIRNFINEIGKAESLSDLDQIEAEALAFLLGAAIIVKNSKKSKGQVVLLGLLCNYSVQIEIHTDGRRGDILADMERTAPGATWEGDIDG